ncbi:pseudouridine synthase [Nadsonia fulvescens var. elongata DSM 6958]|uniref:tRNA pseudouridine synthase 1 n=1 Tax=Nadsonia fulvescens var. elongata DSM 6958 TaxID=857566 RepID=A0A1E3PPH6_9ASCO|nr:pseudouridine synthase [Nadsonia fulvescens var. elongata DSM 6958]
MIGYCGTGYHGMQVNPPQKTIEGDLFEAFVKAGCVSKDNAVDQKKVSFMRAARTDKGVHAAGNVVSLKLIVEDDKVVERINSHLPETIRVWGINRTNKSFECRKMCDSRVYEYLIPSYSFLPPSPSSHLSERIKLASEEHPGVTRADPEGAQFWETYYAAVKEAGFNEEDVIKAFEEATKAEVEANLKAKAKKAAEAAEATAAANAWAAETAAIRAAAAAQTPAAIRAAAEAAEAAKTLATDASVAEAPVAEASVVDAPVQLPIVEVLVVQPPSIEALVETVVEDKSADQESISNRPVSSLKQIKIIGNKIRREYRISPERLELLREAFCVYEGSHNFHNFTIGKDFRDPSALRHMKSLTVSEPFLIEGTEWLSIKIHGQSFMLHQIRKMVAMVALVIRAGCPLERINEAFNQTRINIPKAPSLGLLLEQPVYKGYNSKLETFGYTPVDFEAWKDQIQAFKMKHIYDKIYYEEAKENVFHGFFAFIDSFNGDPIFDFITARGITERTNVSNRRQPKLAIDDDNDDEIAASDNEG